ncbi:hypothetical protein Hanom_Chr03g00237221 [Helianthus anomalus]
MVTVLVTPGKRIDESVIINWKERSYVVWVTEAVGVWKPELEDGNSKDDSAWKSDNGLEVNREDDFEDGEIRIASPPAVGRNVQVAGETSAVHQSTEGEWVEGDDSLHGNQEKSTHIPRCVSREKNVHGDGSESSGFPRNIDDIGDNAAAGSRAQQYQNSDRREENIWPINTPGLMKKAQLGKRDRNVRSPPSVGSIQGNCIRPKHRSVDVNEFSIDLNRSGGNQETLSRCLEV